MNNAEKLFTSIKEVKKIIKISEATTLADVAAVLKTPDRLIKFLSDSNSDWQQGIYNLAQSIELNIRTMFMAGYSPNADLEMIKDLLELKKSSNDLIIIEIKWWINKEDLLKEKTLSEDLILKKISLWIDGTILKPIVYGHKGDNKWTPKINEKIGRLNIRIDTTKTSNLSKNTKRKIWKITENLILIFKDNATDISINADITKLIADWLHAWEMVFIKKFDSDGKKIDDNVIQKYKELFKWYIEITPETRQDSGDWTTYTSIKYELINI